ncbi:type II secretion system F family protein [Microbacterium sp. NPDC076895]|uniref:type II secretion system F family protein n=1 Tax=Microbacterium sp. NPDC076895 TaxID=3154957 RepID=UPI003423EC92
MTTRVAETVLRIAVLLEAGVTPARAWDHLARQGDEQASRVVHAAAGGTRLDSAIASLAAEPAPERRRRFRLTRADAVGESVQERERRMWREVAAAWSIATTVGAPLAPALRSFADVLRDTAESADEIRVALAEPTSTARLLGWLPAVGIGLAFALGFDPLGTLLREPAGWACAAVGIGLLIAGRRWTSRLALAAHRDAAMPGMDADLTAIALSGGVSVSRARTLVDAARGEDADDSVAVRDTLLLSEAAGVPAVELLRSAAALDRHRARVDGRLRAARLSTKLLLPLGICTLPAFLCLGVAPMFLSILPSVSLPLP